MRREDKDELFPKPDKHHTARAGAKASGRTEDVGLERGYEARRVERHTWTLREGLGRWCEDTRLKTPRRKIG